MLLFVFINFQEKDFVMLFFSLSVALQVELFFLSLFSFPTGCVLTGALWVKLSDVSIWWDGGEHEHEGERREGKEKRHYTVR